MKRKIVTLLFSLSIIALTACSTTANTADVVESEPEVVKEVEVVEEPEEIVVSGETKEPEETIYTFTEIDNGTIVSITNCYIRDLPSRKGNKIGELKRNNNVEVTGQCNETGWYRFDYNGTVAYVDDTFVELLEVVYFTPENSNSNNNSKDDPKNNTNKEVLGYTEDGHEIIAYAENGSPILGYTSEGYAISGYDEDGSPICYFTPQNNTSTSSNNSSNGSLPYIVNGIDIRDGDYNGDGINDNNGNTWYEMQTWTASNGYTLRIADAYYINPSPLEPFTAIFLDGTENFEPSSPFKVAMAEYFGRLDLTSISPKDLPQVNTVSSKQTSINVNDPSLLAYKAAFDPLWQKQNMKDASALVISNDRIALGEATVAMDGVAFSYSYLWDISYDATRGDWKFWVRGSYTELGWNAVKNAIRMITPDADAVYDAIYKDCYYGGGGLECEKYEESDWITIGSTQVKADWTSGTLYFRFK